MNTYMFVWNGRRKFIDAEDLFEAKMLFMERFGFDAAVTEGMAVYARYNDEESYILISAY